MPERPTDDSFSVLENTRQELAKHGWYFFPIPKEHTEGRVTDTLIARIRSQIKKRGFPKVAGRSLITFSGYGTDEREIYLIPEARAYWQKLNRELPELPALLGIIEAIRYNGPGMHLSMVGEIDEIIDYPEQERQELHVIGSDRIIQNSVTRIWAAGKKYHLPFQQLSRLLSNFLVYSTYPPNYGASSF